jgi:hypothetical protein
MNNGDLTIKPVIGLWGATAGGWPNTLGKSPGYKMLRPVMEIDLLNR